MKEEIICEAKGHANISCSEGKLCKAHIVTRQFREIKDEPLNKIYICKAHEKYFNSESGKQEWPHFIRLNFPKKYSYVCSKYEFILNEYIQFLKNNTYVDAANVSPPTSEVKESVGGEVIKQAKPAKPKSLCTHACHFQYKDALTAYCWDCRGNHSAYNSPLI